VFADKCKVCGHVVASHVFRFRVEGDFQVLFGPRLLLWSLIY